MTTEAKWRCGGCKWVARTSELLTCKHPFEDGATLRACPGCKAIFGEEELHPICAIEGCERYGSIGGYFQSGAMVCPYHEHIAIKAKEASRSRA